MATVDLLALLAKKFAPGPGPADPDTPYMKPGAVGRVPALKNELLNYIKSPLYASRLQKMKVGNASQVVKDRVANLNKVDVVTGDHGELEYGFFDGAGGVKYRPRMTIRSNETPYVTMHELSHTTNAGEAFFAKPVEGLKKGGMNTANGKTTSLAELLYITDRIKNKKLSKEIRATAESRAKTGTFANPTDGMKGDGHYFDPSELKSDVDAMRLLFKNSKLTKQFGENITPEIIEKAKKDPKIANEPHFKRLLQVYDEKDLIDINNNIAKRDAGVNTNV